MKRSKKILIAAMIIFFICYDVFVFAYGDIVFDLMYTYLCIIMFIIQAACIIFALKFFVPKFNNWLEGN